MLALLITAAVTGAAPAPAAAPKLDPAAVQAAGVLVQQLGVRQQITLQMNQTVKLMREGVAIRAMLAQQPGFAQAYQANRAKFDPVLKKVGGMQADIAQKVIADNTGAVVNAAVNAYARQFTAAELRGLAAFYNSPLGKAVNAKQPLVAAEIGQATNRLMAAKVDAALQANAQKLNAALAPLNSGPPPAKK
jgi:hypothetical protein